MPEGWLKALISLESAAVGLCARWQVPRRAPVNGCSDPDSSDRFWSAAVNSCPSEGEDHMAVESMAPRLRPREFVTA